jgi:hypothetical protein
MFVIIASFRTEKKVFLQIDLEIHPAFLPILKTYMFLIKVMVNWLFIFTPETPAIY